MNLSSILPPLLHDAAPPGLRWTIARARGADHPQTPLVARPEALLDTFSPDCASRSVSTKREAGPN